MNQFTKIFVQENVFENVVCNMSAILFRPYLTRCGLEMQYVNIGSGNGLLPDGTKPLPEPVLTYHQ